MPHPSPLPQSAGRCLLVCVIITLVVMVSQFSLLATEAATPSYAASFAAPSSATDALDSPSSSLNWSQQLPFLCLECLFLVLLSTIPSAGTCIRWQSLKSHATHLVR